MTDLPSIGRPAASALADAGYTHLEQLRDVPMEQIAALHGVGPKAVRILAQARDQLDAST